MRVLYFIFKDNQPLKLVFNLQAAVNLFQLIIHNFLGETYVRHEKNTIFKFSRLYIIYTYSTYIIYA